MKGGHDLLADAAIGTILVPTDVHLRAITERLLSPLQTAIVPRCHLASETHRLAGPLHLEELNLVPYCFEILERPAHTTR